MQDRLGKYQLRLYKAKIVQNGRRHTRLVSQYAFEVKLCGWTSSLWVGYHDVGLVYVASGLLSTL